MTDASPAGLLDFARRRARSLVVIGFFGFAATGLTMSLWTEQRSVIVHYVELKGFLDESYPNGAKFSPQDLVSPDVLKRLSERVEIPVEKLRRALNVDYGTPQVAGLLRRNEAALAQRNLRPQEIEAINTQFANDLRSVSHSGLRIAVTKGELGVSDAKAKSIAELLPSTWNEIFVTHYRVLDNRSVIASGLPDTPNMRTASDFVAADIIVSTMWNSLATIEKDPRTASAQSSKGLAISELKAEIGRFRILTLNPIFAYAASNPASAPAFAAFARESRLQLAEAQANIDALDRTISDLQRTRGDRIEPSGSNGVAKSGENIQISDGALKQMLDLYDRAMNSEYLRRIFERRERYSEERARLATALDRIPSAERTPAVTLEIDLQQAEKRLVEIRTEYQSLIESVRQTLIRDRGVFYESTGGTESGYRPFGVLVIFFGSLMAGFLLAAATLLSGWFTRRAK